MRRRVLVAIAHPTIAAGVVEVLRLDPDVDVLRVAPDVAAARAHEWHADLILADSPSAVALRGLASIVMVTAAGDGVAAREAAQEIGAAGWLFVDEIDREIDRFFGRRMAAVETRRERAVAIVVAIASVASLTIGLGLVWAALIP